MFGPSSLPEGPGGAGLCSGGPGRAWGDGGGAARHPQKHLLSQSFVYFKTPRLGNKCLYPALCVRPGSGGQSLGATLQNTN